MTLEQWTAAHHTKEGTDPDDEEEDPDDDNKEHPDSVGPKAKPVPPMPIIENPGYFIIKGTWKVKTTIMRKREEHSQKLQIIPLEDQH